MAISNITTEDGNILVMENVAGITGATSLNDAYIIPLFKETFTVNPATNGWVLGSGWAWNAGAGNITFV